MTEPETPKQQDTITVIKTPESDAIIDSEYQPVKMESINNY